jgi:hypothetical protein
MNVKAHAMDWARGLRMRGMMGAIVAAAAAAGAMSCAQTPVTPSGNTTVTTPALAAPANGAQIANLKQPVTLTINNAFVTDSSASVVYNFEVATDAAFNGKIQTPTAPAGSSGQTSVVLAALPAGQTYFWHVRTTGGNTVGTFSAPGTFTIGPALGLTAPTVVAPQSGATPSGWPTFTVTNTVRTGPVPLVTYRFDVSTTTTFATTVLTATVAEGPGGQTSFTPNINTPVPAGTLLYWRATALDAPDNVSSPASTTQSFTPQPLTQQAILANIEGVSLWPGVQPPGTNGHATLGDGWSVTQYTSFNGVTFLSPPLEELQEFDLIDRGMDPQAAITWMQTHGYTNDGVWVPAINVVGFPFEYIFLNMDTGAWDLVLRVGG